MIYLIPKDIYPSDERVVEELIFKDLNGFEWKIARLQNGFIITFNGDPYFIHNPFTVDLSDSVGLLIKIENTNCIFIQNEEFEVFAEIRDIILENETDDVWCTFEDMLKERFRHDAKILESEKLI